MKRLEQLLEQVYPETRLEGFLVFYSCSSTPPLDPKPISFGAISAYADSLNKQFGVPSPSVKPRAPSSLATANNFDAYEIMQSLKKHYIPLVSEEELAYANSINQQFNAPSPTIKPVTSHAPSPETFNPQQILDVAKSPIYPYLSDNNLPVSSSPIKPVIDTSIYKPEFRTPEIIAPKFYLPKPTPYRGGISSKDEILDSKPFKYFDDFRKNEVKTFTEGVYNKKDFLKVLDLFEDNKLPKIFDRVTQNLHMKPKSVTMLILTNPYHARSSLKEGPNFLKYADNHSEIRLPITQPKFIPFIKTDKQKYRDIALNSFLPHEQSHANITEKYGDIGITEGLIGFNEHLADTMAKDSLGVAYIKSESCYQNMWADPSEKKSELTEDYSNYLNLKKSASNVPAHMATINILEDQRLKEQVDGVLKHTLEMIYPDEQFRKRVSDDIYELSNIYQTKALKITELSKRDSMLSNFKAKRMLSDVEKRTFKFLEEL